MDFQIINTLISLCGSLVGTFAGIFATSKLTEYRIKKLEEKVDKHNGYSDIIAKMQTDIAVMKNDLSYIKQAISRLEK